MDQIRANTPAPIKANLMTEQLSVQMSWGKGGCTRAGSPGDQQSRELGPWAPRRSRAMMRANAWGHDELTRMLSAFDLMLIKLSAIALFWTVWHPTFAKWCRIEKHVRLLWSYQSFASPYSFKKRMLNTAL